MKKQTITVIFKDLNNLTIKKDRSEWINELTEYTLNLALLDDDYSSGILDEFLRSGFKGYDNMTENEIISEVIEHLEYKYDMENA
jgi:hypothetical protein